MGEIRAELAALDANAVHAHEIRAALEEFDPVWKSLNTNEQARIIRVLVERVGYDGRTGRVAVTFRAAGLKALCGGPE